VIVLRRDVEMGRGKIKNLQQQKSDVETVSNGEFGMQIDSKHEIAPGDYISAYTIEIT
jgi:translation initiation factor IF-2